MIIINLVCRHALYANVGGKLFHEMRVGLILFIALTFFSCSKSSDNRTDEAVLDNLVAPTIDSVTSDDTTHYDYHDLFKLTSYLTKRTIDGGETDTVDFDCAVLIYPNDDQIEEMKKEGEEDFYIIADDNNWYQGLAIEIIDSVGIKKTTTDKRFLRLKGLQNTWDLDIRKKNLPAWNMIFFKTTKEPMIVSTIDLTVDQVKDYFEVQP